MSRLHGFDLSAASIAYLLCGSILVSFVESTANYKPVIDPRPYFSVPEDTPVGFEIAVITATDSENDPIRFSLERSFTLLAINASTGALTLEKTLDRENKDFYTFKVFAEDDYVGGDRKAEETFYLNVGDTNDNKPRFINSPYIGRVAENETVGHVVLRVSADDVDQGANQQITYKFSNNTQGFITPWETDKFKINNLNGAISIAGRLDFETVQRYTLFAVAQDAGSPRQESLTTVIVDVIDVSDNPPRFLKSTYLEEVGENTAIGTEIVRVEAVDGDVAVNNPLEFAIVAGNDRGIFKINATSGSITVNGSIDAEQEDFYRVTVRAVEIPDPSFNATVLVIVTVVDRNDNPPQFPKESFHFLVREDVARPGYIVTDQLNVRDGDKNPEFRQFKYSLSGEEGDTFAVENGILTINATLDYEQKSNYTFEIFANETKTSEKLWGSAIVTVELVNVNDNNPVFKELLYTFTLKEEVQAGVVIGQITASDADLGTFGEITYELVGEGAALFAVVTTNGTISTTGLLDYEKSSEYTFALLAKDGGGFYEKRNATTIKVILEDENDNAPMFEGLPYTVNILESEGTGRSVFQVKATDKDSGDNGRVSYNITAGNAGNAFSVNASGLVWLTKELDRERWASYLLTIMAYDHGNSSRNQTTVLTVSVGDVNDNKPVVLGAPYISTNLSENSGGGTIVYKLQASDADAGNNKLLTYAIVDGNEEGRFILNSGTGILQISPTGLDREISPSYNLTVNVTDSGDPVQWQSLVLRVDVLDVNDHTPRFDPNPSDAVYFIDVMEGPGSLGQQVLDVNATDKDDGRNAEIRYSLSGDEHDFFMLDAITGVLRINKTLDRENFTLDARERGVIILEITATDQAEPRLDRKAATVRVTVYVLDLNDNTPLFVNPPSSVQVSEAARPGTNIVQLSAVDADSQFNGHVDFNITNGDPDGIFKITSNGNLLVEKNLNAEEVDMYNLTIEAKDKGDPPKASTTLLQVQVDDVNDNDPKFNQSSYMATVWEDANYSTPALTVFAEDPDKGSNGDILYSIISGDNTGMFTINNKTGLISIAGVLDREKVPQYTLTVQAEDQGHPSSRKDFASVVITLLDVNDNAPKFTQDSYDAEIEEGASGGRVVQAKDPIRATDEDDGNNAVVIFSLSGPGSENFIINFTTGIIATSTNCSLDRERNSSYNLQLKVTDGGGKSSTADLRVKLLDINDEPPRFSQAIYYANISESSQRGTTVRKVTATDLDEGINKEITYTSTGADAKFYISRATGDIIVDAALDREFKSLYILNVTAANFGENSPEGYTQVYITVTDVIDDKPFFVTESTIVHIAENVSIGTNVTRIVANDKDIDDTLTYSVVGGDILQQFALNSTTGVVTTTRTLDRENTTELTLLIQARDSLNLTSDNFKLIVKVDDVNDNAPVFAEESYLVKYREESHEGTSILKVAATDADSGISAEISFSILEENATNYVSIDANSGQISQGQTKLDREKSPQFNFTVRATDRGIPAKTSEVKVALQLVDINDNAPKFEEVEYDAFIKENLAADTFVLAVTATDRDIETNGKILYGFQGRNPLFKIDEHTGNITTNGELNREETGEYTLIVVAQDEGIPSLQGTTRVIVTVTDDNDHTPKFSRPQYTFTVKENEGPSHVIGNVLATDGDKDNNSKISYSISSGNEGDALQINETTGTISVKSKLDRELVPRFTLVVLASDNGDQPRQSNTTVVLTIEDVNDNKPRFNQSIYNVTLKESTFKRTVVQQLSASDPDELANGQFTFSIRGGNSEDIFEIDADTGVVKLKNELDYERTQSYNLTIEAKDSGSPKLSGFAFLWVTVVDVDDNAPVFHQEAYDFTVYENVTLGDIIGHVNATDVDADKVHSTVQFAIESGNLDGVFAIGLLNGSLYVSRSGQGPDRESKAQYQLIVSAVSSKTNSSAQKSTVPVSVTILDVNDNAPKFLKDGYRKSVYEDVKNITKQDDNTLLTISASDGDEGLNSEVVYTIVSGNDKGFFSLDNITGVLSKVKMLDREYKDFHSLTVLVTDRGVPSLSSRTRVNITILDMNDNHPVMEVKEHAYFISENSTLGTLLTKVEATDKDIDLNGRIQFSFISGNEDGAFQLDPLTGELKTAKQLDYESKKSYQLTIQAQDLGQPPLSSNDLITVQLRNIDDNRPTFVEKQTSLSVGENLGPGAIVGTLGAKDLDGNSIFYYIKAGNEDNAFYLNDTSGILETRKTLDREVKEKHILYVLASNVQLDPVTLKPRVRRDVTNPTISPEPDIQLVEIEIADENDNGPKFTEEIFTGGVPGDAKFGSDVLRVEAMDPDTGNTSKIAYEILDTKDGRLFSIVRDTGWIQAKESYAKLSGTELVIEVIAKDNFGQEPYFNDTAIVKIYVLTDELQSLLISKRQPNYVRLRKDELKRVLENITGYTINIDDINYYKEGEKYDFSKTAVLFHAVDPATGKVVNRDTVIREIDQNYHRYMEFFQEMQIQEVKPQVEPAEEEEFPIVLAVVIALGIIVGLLLCIFCCVVCNLRKRQKRKLRAATAASYGGSSTKGVGTGPVTILPTTNLHTSEGSNPVWVDPFHNWGMKTDDEDVAVDYRNPSPFYGGGLPPVTPDPKMFFDAQELPMDVFRSGHADAPDDDNSSTSSGESWSSGKKSSSTSRSGEPYESSPMGERPYIPEPSNKYKVTRI